MTKKLIVFFLIALFLMATVSYAQEGKCRLCGRVESVRYLQAHQGLCHGCWKTAQAQSTSGDTRSITFHIGFAWADSAATDDGRFDFDDWFDASGDIDTTNITTTQWLKFFRNRGDTTYLMYPDTSWLATQYWISTQGFITSGLEWSDTTGDPRLATNWDIDSTYDSLKAWVEGQGYGIGTGDITSVTAGSGLVGGGIASDVTLNILNRWGITVWDDSLEVDTSLVATQYDISDMATETWVGEQGFITATLTEEEVEDFAGGMWTGNTATRATVIYQDDDGTIDIVVDDMNDDVPEAADYSALTGGDGVENNPTGTIAVLLNGAGGLETVDDSINIKLSGSTLALSGDGLSVSSVAGVTGANEDDVSIGDVQTACSNDFHGIGGTDDDLPDADEVTEAMLKAVNAAADEDILTHESTTGDFEWHTPDELDLQVDADTSSWDATKTDILTMTEDGDTTAWLATKTDILTMQEDGDTTSWDATKTDILTMTEDGDTTSWLATKTELGGKSDTAAVGYLAQAETITGNWVNTDNPWADNEIASSGNWNTAYGWGDWSGEGFITAADVPANETDAAHDNFSELAGSASDGQVDDNITVTGYQQDSDTTTSDLTKTQAAALYQGKFGNFQCTIIDPKNVVGGSAVVWKNGISPVATITIDSINALSQADDYSFTLTEYTNTGAAAGGTVDAIDVDANGTGMFYKTETSLTHNVIETGNIILFTPNETDSTNWVKLIGYFHW